MKRAMVNVLLLVTAVMLAAPQAGVAQAPIRVYVDGQLVGFDVPPNVIQGRVLVPLRGIFERLGATVDYDARTQHIVAVRGPQTVELTIGSRQARVNESAKLLDVPAFTINGRTMVPLRFISESLGAGVNWIDASRTILISSTGAILSAPPQATAPAAASTVSGRIVGITMGNSPSIVLRVNGANDTIAVTPATAIYRYNADSGAGGSAALGSLRRGDSAVVEVNGQNQANKITASFHISSAGRIATVNAGNRTFTLANGTVITVLPDAIITLNGQAADFSAIQVGRVVSVSLIEGTSQAYEVKLATSTAAPPQPLAAPTITSPANGATVGTALVVSGKARPGALVVVRAQPRLLGEATQAQTTAQADGTWRVAMNLQSFPLVSFPYVIAAVQILNGVQSDASSIEVTVH